MILRLQISGLFGFITLGLLQIPFYFIRGVPPLTEHPGDRLEDPIDALIQIKNSWQLLLAVLGGIQPLMLFSGIL